MTNSRTRIRSAAWAVPAAVALAIGAVAAVPQLSQAATPKLPSVTAEELLVKMGNAKPTAFSGTVQVSSNLGLPDLSGIKALKSSQAASPLSLLTGTQTLKVWADPGTGSRANIEGESSEYSVIATKSEVWTYSSADRQALHVVIPDSVQKQAKDKAAAAKEKAGELPTPDEVASKVLKDIDPSTALAIDDTARVAGRDSYQIIATPKDSGSLVASVRIAIDAETYQPLRAQVYSTSDSAKPAIETGFTKISYAKPAASVFAFTPPKGTDVTTETVPDNLGSADKKHSSDYTEPDTAVTGKGWASVVEVKNAGAIMKELEAKHAKSDDAKSSDPRESESSNSADALGEEFGGDVSSDDLSSLIGQMSKKVDGGTVYTTTLFSVMVTDDGRVLAGAVPSATLVAAAK